MSGKILLVDDEKEYVEVLAERLQARGFQAYTAFSGDEALARLNDLKPDVVILDLFMPGKDGIETLREIKAAEPLIEVIMLTGHGTIETAIEGMRNGAFDYLMKPTDLQDLLSKIGLAMARKAEHDERIRQAEIERIMKTRGW